MDWINTQGLWFTLLFLTLVATINATHLPDQFARPSAQSNHIQKF